MIARPLLFAFSLIALLAAPSVARADDDEWHHDNGWHGRHGWHEHHDRDERRWEHDGYRESGYREGYQEGYEDGDRYRWNHDVHAYWSPHRHCWIHDSGYYWDNSDYHWVPGPAGNFILIHLNL